MTLKFQVAAELGMSVGQVEDTLTPEEFVLWGKFFEWRSDKIKKS